MRLDIRERASPNFDERAAPVDLVVLHYTGMQDGETALRRLTDAAPRAGAYPGPWQAPDADPDAVLARVSAHWCIDEAGVCWRLVAEDKRAWHAGEASWEGRGDINSRAIGIEIVNGGHDFGLPDFTPPQIDALVALLTEMLMRWKLSPSRVVAHADVAPMRKADPGENFPWKRLADAGVSIWPDYVAMQASAAPDAARIQRQLAAFGYGAPATGMFDDGTRACLTAFQRRFRPARVDGAPDEETQALLAALTAPV